MHSRKHLAGLTFALFWIPIQAQLGLGWTEYSPAKKIHLDGSPGLPTTFDWVPHLSNCTPSPCVEYDFDSAANTETFHLIDNRTNRAEIRLYNDYTTGSRQFEGYVTFYPPLDNESLMQVWGSTSGATQLMVRGYSDNGGCIRAQGVLLATNLYGKEVRVNVIHQQEDVGNRFRVYINGELKTEFADNEHVPNYHKYGCYGSLKTAGAMSKWRNVRHFKDGQPPSGNVDACCDWIKRV